MTIGLIFWILMIIWLVFSVMWHWGGEPWASFGPRGNAILLFVLFLLLGWAVFGTPVRG